MQTMCGINNVDFTRGCCPCVLNVSSVESKWEGEEAVRREASSRGLERSNDVRVQAVVEDRGRRGRCEAGHDHGRHCGDWLHSCGHVQTSSQRRNADKQLHEECGRHKCTGVDATGAQWCLSGAMTALCLTFLLSAAVSAAGSSLERTKRGVLELGGIIKCTTQSPAFAYLWYGCYCGLGGHGNPVDETDECCHQHDCCYNRAEKEGCKPKTDRYKWTCEDNMAICDALTDQCEKILCKCDREFGDCLKNARYSRMYTVWPNFFCSDEKKSCN
ncbi:phospholipase A2-like isoform X4 [Nerophis ophidion]|uniref:phospholipase A2-like isoform X4 n=1 Tax=Nerophis ophidion TaxID=159077 RepID=UPI002ADF9F88|nr:phospholipase A2-like isoform X4 [Nerophis ophidion]